MTEETQIHGYRTTGNVDNQLGTLHNLFKRNCVINQGIQFQPYNDNHKNVLIAKNVIPTNLANRVRKFIDSIPFDSKVEQLNDTDNKPNKTVYESLQDLEQAEKAYNNKNSNSDEWTWEKYHYDFYRALPTTSESFIGSPIIELFNFLEMKFYSTRIPNINMSLCHKGCWVIQKIIKDHGIGIHSDNGYGRKLAFVYYLTPDDWNYEEDGGALCIYDENDQSKYISINPEFNSIIMWNTTNENILHSVENVKSNKERISLVGFFYEN